MRMRTTVLSVARKHGATNVRVFGSFARGDQKKTSDIDLLVDLPERSSLLDLVDLKLALEKALRRKVDLVTTRGLSPYLRDRVLREAWPL
jgi:predicted nucleotidyltransferase